MNRNRSQPNRRSFLVASGLTGLSVSIPALASSRVPGPTPPGNRVVITQVIWDGQHPVMDNPYYRTQEQVDALVNKAGKINAAIGIKLMGLSHLLKQPIDLSEHLR
jgi:hypothetical protein